MVKCGALAPAFVSWLMSYPEHWVRYASEKKPKVP